jgi:hypothetical protein
LDVPKPPQAVAALAAFLGERLGTVSDTLAGFLARREPGRAPGTELLPADADRSVVAAARELALVIVGAAAPFAPTAYSRARLIRQMHASGLLTDEHVRRAHQVLEVEPGGSGASR